VAEYVIIEWNQASGQPRLMSDDLYDAQEAVEIAREHAARTREVGRRESYSVHPVDLDEPWWEDGDDAPPRTMHAPVGSSEVDRG
jgi:hypothetical protein